MATKAEEREWRQELENAGYNPDNHPRLMPLAELRARKAEWHQRHEAFLAQYLPQGTRTRCEK